MLVFINIVLFVVIVFVSVRIYNYVMGISEQSLQLQKDVKELGQQLKIGNTKDAKRLPLKSEFRIAIEIVDPIALARKESAVARIATEIAPHYVTKEVYKRFTEEITDAMKDKGIDINISLLTL